MNKPPADADAEPFNIFSLLKNGTAEIHQRTEERVPVFRDDFDLAAYTRLLEQFYGFWSPVEARLWELPELREAAGLTLQTRLKSCLLREDLQVLGRDPAPVRQCEKLPRLDGFLEGIGCLYVLEGSTLGAQIIARRLNETLRLDQQHGASFFNAYGPSTRSHWSQFKNFVTGRVRSADAGRVVEAARDTFTCFYEWLGAA